MALVVGAALAVGRFGRSGGGRRALEDAPRPKPLPLPLLGFEDGFAAVDTVERVFWDIPFIENSPAYSFVSVNEEAFA